MGVDYAWMYEMLYTYDALIGVSVQSVSAMDEYYAPKVAKQKANSHPWFQLKVYKCLLAFTQHCTVLQVAILLMWDWWVQIGVLMWLIIIKTKIISSTTPTTSLYIIPWLTLAQNDMGANLKRVWSCVTIDQATITIVAVLWKVWNIATIRITSPYCVRDIPRRRGITYVINIRTSWIPGEKDVGGCHAVWILTCPVENCSKGTGDTKR